jgi:hypothetical protein
LSDTTTDTLQQNLHKNWEFQQRQFQVNRQEMIETAQRRIHLKNGVQSIQRCLQCRSVRKSAPSAFCPLENLQLGEETTCSLFDMIADYAGFPSEGETKDCQLLIFVAHEI